MEHRTDKDKHKKETESQLQSYPDLITRRNSIKRAIILSNRKPKLRLEALKEL
jgi:hypothetical protein